EIPGMLASPVETLSFDLLQFLYHLSLAILVGGSLVLGTAVAPALFVSSRSPADAGTLFGSVLARFDGLAIFSVIVLVITSVLKAVGFEVTARQMCAWCCAGSPLWPSRSRRSTRAHGPILSPGRSAPRPPGSTSNPRASPRGSSSRDCTRDRASQSQLLWSLHFLRSASDSASSF